MRDIKFHVGDVSVWIDQQLAARDRSPFLSHIFLDLPSSRSNVGKAVSALRVNGKLILFNPSVTQINAAIELVNAHRLSLQLERVLEVGPAMTGGRGWDVRLVRPRALTREASDRSTLVEEVDDSQLAGNQLDGRSRLNMDEGLRMVCKPKIGDRISGGGFVALWSKNRTRNDSRRTQIFQYALCCPFFLGYTTDHNLLLASFSGSTSLSDRTSTQSATSRANVSLSSPGSACTTRS